MRALTAANKHFRPSSRDVKHEICDRDSATLIDYGVTTSRHSSDRIATIDITVVAQKLASPLPAVTLEFVARTFLPCSVYFVTRFPGNV